MPPAFSLDKKFLGVPTDVQLTLQGPDDNSVFLAVAANATFPPGKLPLGSVTLSASTGESIPFSSATGKGNVSFQASADGFFEAGIYVDPADLRHDLSPESDIASGIALTAAPGSRFLMLRCGYDATASAKGAMALGTGASVNFGGAFSKDAAYAVIRQFPDSASAADVLGGTIKSWILPNQFDGLDRLPPRTWIVTELDGSIALNLGVQAGYDYSWLRQFPGGALKGDLGLKVQLAANAALGFSASGTYAMALSRETDAPAIRLRLYKLAKNGWNFALNASAGEQVQLPEVFQQGKKVDDLISAVFGIHVAQLVQDLADPSAVGPASVAKFIEQRGMKEFQDLTGISPDQIVAAGQAKVKEFVEQWNALTHKPATMLASILQKNPDVAELTRFLQDIQGKGAADVQAAIADALKNVAFFQTAIGQWIESVVPTTALAAVSGTSDWKTVQDLSGKALAILNGQTLQTLIDYATKNLGLDNIKNAAEDVEGFNLDRWLQAKIANFLGKDPTAQLVSADIQKAQAALKALLDKADEFYTKATEAIQKKYEIDFAASYQASSSSTALIDAVFDLTQAPLDALTKAIDGDFRELLLRPIPGVTLNTAALTHDINRQSHCDLSLPFVNLEHGDVADSLARVSPVEDGGRVLMYQVDSSDEVTDSQRLFGARAVSDSKLVLKAQFPVATTGVAQFSQPSVSCGYTLQKASLGMGAVQLTTELRPLADQYLRGVFADDAALGAWTTALLDAVNPPQPGILGKTLLELDVALPPDVFAGWCTAPADPRGPAYVSLSLSMQASLRRLVPFCFFDGPNKYDMGPLSDSVLAYAALPPATGNGTLYFIDFGNFEDPSQLTVRFQSPQFREKLGEVMGNADALLTAVPQLANRASSYAFNNDNIERILRNAMTGDPTALPTFLRPLLQFEFDLIQGIVGAATQLAKFRQQAASDPESAVNALSQFGVRLVQSFNDHLGGDLGIGNQLRPMGIALMVEAANALILGPPPAGAPAGLFRLFVMSPQSAPTVDDLLAGKFDPSQAISRQTLASPRPGRGTAAAQPAP